MITAEEAQDYPDEAKPVQAKPANPLDLVAPKMVEIEEQPIIEEEVSEVVEVVTTGSLHIYIPNKEEPHASYETLEAWQDAYEDLSDKTARAGKVPPRERMTILKQLKEANEATLKTIDTVLRARHTTAHLKRIKALGAILDQD
jgi:hypothetical protein